MKILYETILKIPTWALSTLINADDSGLENREISMINNWENSMHRQFPDCYMIVKPLENGYYFAYHPEFGSGADVTDCNIIMAKKG